MPSPNRDAFTHRPDEVRDYAFEVLDALATISEVQVTAPVIETTIYGDRYASYTPSGEVTLRVTGFREPRQGIIPLLPEVERLAKENRALKTRVSQLCDILRQLREGLRGTRSDMDKVLDIIVRAVGGQATKDLPS